MEWIEDFRAGRLIINCETLEDYRELMVMLRAEGMRWASGEVLEQTNGFAYGDKSCVKACNNSSICRGRRSFYETDDNYKNIPLLRFSELGTSEEPLEAASDDELALLFNSN